jgi:hypothetical protein
MMFLIPPGGRAPLQAAPDSWVLTEYRSSRSVNNTFLAISAVAGNRLGLRGVPGLVPGQLTIETVRLIQHATSKSRQSGWIGSRPEAGHSNRFAIEITSGLAATHPGTRRSLPTTPFLDCYRVV